MKSIQRNRFYESQFLFSTALNLTLYPHVLNLYIELHPKDILYNWYATTKYYKIDTSVSTATTLFSYDHIEIEQLEYPYSTNCFHYTNVGLRSQSHCLSNCYEYHYYKTFNQTINQVYADTEHDLPFKKVMTGDLTVRDKNNHNLKISNHCLIQCTREDCKKTFFSPLFVSQNSGEPKIVKIEIDIPSSPTANITYKPRIFLIDVVTYVLSYVSFWLGWSPLGFLTDIYVKRIRAFFRTDNHVETNESISPRSRRQNVLENDRHIQTADGSYNILSRRLAASIVRTEMDRKKMDMKITALYSLMQTFKSSK